MAESPHDIIADNISGSSGIAAKIIDWLASATRPGSTLATEEIEMNLKKLEEKFQHFAVVRHLILAVRQHLVMKEYDINAQPELLKAVLSDYRRTWEDNQRLAAIKMAEQMDFAGKTLLLHSHSGSLIFLFELLYKKGIHVNVIQTVSEPGKEGIVQAGKIAGYAFNVRLINEAAASRFIGDADMLITGADAVYRQHIVNKTGTFQLALLFRYYRKPFYVLADSRKFIGNDPDFSEMENRFHETEKPPEEILMDPPAGIIPVNYYFEEVPRELVRQIFTETR